MADSQSQSTNEGQAATPDSQPQQLSASTAESQSQSTPEGQAVTSEPNAQRESISVWAIGGQLEVDVGDGERVPVPNTSGRPPTREEIHQALVAAGHQERADKLANRAYRNVSGTV
jgi:hypothetical protein